MKPKSQKGVDRREQILVAARRVLIEDGYDALVMRDVAARIGIKLGNLQYYFPTREVLVEAVVRAEAETDLDDLTRLCPSKDEVDEEFTRFVKYIVKKWRGDSGKILETMGFLSLHQTSLRQTYVEIYDRFYEELGRVIQRMVPDIEHKAAIDKARLVTALLDGAAMQVQRGSKAGFLRDVAGAATAIAIR